MLDHAASGGSGVVDHDIDTSKRLGALLDEISGVRVRAQIGGNGGESSPPLLVDVFRGGVDRALSARADGACDGVPVHAPLSPRLPPPLAPRHPRRAFP